MYNNNINEKHCVPARRRRSPFGKKQLLVIVGIAMLYAIVSGACLALVFTDTDPVENTFKSSYVACDVLEGSDGNSFDGVTKTDVRIKNTGDVQSYIRASVVATWVSATDPDTVTALKPLAGNDYTIVYGTSAKWKQGSDGYWYYTAPVDPGNVTDDLIERCVCSVTPPEGYYLSVEIVASSIQSTPAYVVTEQWSSGVSGVSTDDGITLLIKQ